MFLQGHGVQVQRAVAGLLLPQVLQQCRGAGHGPMPDLPRQQFEDVVVLLHLDQVAVVELTEQQVLRGLEQLLHPAGDELRAVVAEAADPQPWLGARRQVVEVVAQALEQRMFAIVAAHHDLVPAVEGDLVQGQHQVLAHPGIAQ